jgi:hypothetical protein
MKKALAKEPGFKLKATAGTETIMLTAQTLVNPVALLTRPKSEDKLEACLITPPLQLSYKRSHSVMVDRTPTKPLITMPVPPVPTPMPLLFADNFEPPPLTAPAATGRLGRAGRTNKVNSQQD